MSSEKKQRNSKLDAMGFRTDGEKLIAYLQGQIDKINAVDEKKLERVLQARALLFQHHASNKVVPMIMSTFGVSEATAWRDMRLVDLIFGPTEKMSKDLRRAIAQEMILKTRELAEAKKDTRTMAQCEKNFISLHALDKEDPELPDLSNFEFHPIIVAALPEQVGINPSSEEEILKKLSEWYAVQGDDVEFEDLPDDPA